MKESDFFKWRREITTRFQEIQDSSDIYSLLKTETQNMEYDYFALCVRHPVPFTRPKLTLHTTYPEAWLEHYQAENYYVIDPVLKPQNYQMGYLPWSDALFSGVAEELWKAARDHGLVKGVTQCVIAPNRAQGFLSVSGTNPRGHTMPDDELALRLQHLVEQSLVTMSRLEDPAATVLEMKLSKREKEILQWTAEGKTSAEIAIILSISENTVNFHQKNMQKKFNAPNKTQIACYAAAIGLI
ncbi:transcriptional regulator SdiA [Cronobacter dublinensis]|uniref:transcriptional regulator SdiA n=1 Tax=Cronobacter dublinensis TaxID=413497 RepID=UPI000CFAA451|nr:transcriptional regulator SdiA [Cronobacter dublinensis]